MSEEEREVTDRKVRAWEARLVEIFRAGGLMEVHDDVVLVRVDDGKGWPYFRPLLPRERQ